MSLGDVGMRGFAGMRNLIGTLPEDAESRMKGLGYLHDYGKAPRPGRKLGHVTVVEDSVEKRDSALAHMSELLFRGTD